jgi:uncharacterized protein (DUF697 family)
MAKPSLSDFGSVWKTIREVDVSAVRREAERAPGIVCVGDRAALEHVARLLREGPDRYGPQPSPLVPIALHEVRSRLRAIASADLLIVALDIAALPTDAEIEGLRSLLSVGRPARMLAVLGQTGRPLPPWIGGLGARSYTFVDPRAAAAPEHLARAVLDALPAGQHLAAARRLPGLRSLVARRLTIEVSLTNGALAVASGLPSVIIALGLPVAAADTLIMTKNQALMVYRLALAHGAPPEFQHRMIEITPVIGGAVLWRQVAAGLVGLIPGYGVLPKTAVAYAGTYITGRVAELWYQRGAVGKDDLQRIRAEAAERAKAASAKIVARARRAAARRGHGEPGSGPPAVRREPGPRR